MEKMEKRQPGPLSGGRISGERVPAPDCRCQHGLFSESKCKCLNWQREWGDVPKAITEATKVVKPSKNKSKASTPAKPKAPAKKETKKK
jgi:hypothetical protein